MGGLVWRGGLVGVPSPQNVHSVEDISPPMVGSPIFSGPNTHHTTPLRRELCRRVSADLWSPANLGLNQSPCLMSDAMEPYLLFLSVHGLCIQCDRSEASGARPSRSIYKIRFISELGEFEQGNRLGLTVRAPLFILLIRIGQSIFSIDLEHFSEGGSQRSGDTINRSLPYGRRPRCAPVLRCGPLDPQPLR